MFIKGSILQWCFLFYLRGENMAKKINKSPVEQEYYKQVKRIKSFISRVEKRGYIFEEKVIPVKPKRVTQASVRKLKKLTPQQLYKKAVYGGELTQGEIVKGTKGQALEKLARKEARKHKFHIPTQEPTNTPGFIPPHNVSTDQSMFDNTVILRFTESISHYNRSANYVLNQWLDRVLAQAGRHDTAVMLENAQQAGLLALWQVAYNYEKLIGRLNVMLDYLPEMTSMWKSDIMDAMEIEEDFNPVQ